MVRSTHPPPVETALAKAASVAGGASTLILEPRSKIDLEPFQDVLPLLCRDVEARFGRRVRLAPLGVIERPFSHVMRAGLWHDGDTGPREHLFVKVSKPKDIGGSPDGMRKRVENDFAVTERVFARMSGGQGYGAVRAFACYPAHLTIVTEEVAGETLLAVLERDLRWALDASRGETLVNALTAVGRWIRAFQEPSSEVVPDGWIERYVDHRLKQIAAATRHGQRLRASILGHVQRTLAALGSHPVGKVTVHADLSPSNVMLSNREVVILDFAMSRLGHPLQDVARLYVQLELLGMKPLFRRRDIALLQHALLRGFDPSFDVANPAFRLQLLAQHINHLASLTRPRRGLEGVYNAFVRRQHISWLEREATSGGQTVWA